MAKDSPTPLAVEEHDHDDEDEIELSLDLSIGRGFRKSPDTNLFLNSSVPPQTHGGGDSQHGDTEGGNSKVQRKRKRNETQTNGFDDKTWYHARSSERETISPMLKDLHPMINTSDSQILSTPVQQHNESGIVTPVLWRLNQGNQEPVVTGGGKNDENGSGAGSSSIVSSSGFKSSASQQDCSKSSEEGGIDPIGIHGAITSSNPNTNGPPPCSRHHKKDKEADNHKPSPPATNTQLEEPHNNNSQTLRPPRIPCVSTTGNGPHGRTISGFLYKYTNTEISIVCACHGNSFSPAQFVEHAGGVDISHPLRLITLIPSPFRPFAS